MQSPTSGYDAACEAEIESWSRVFETLRISMDGAYFLPSMASIATSMRSCGVIWLQTEHFRYPAHPVFPPQFTCCRPD